MSSSATLDLDTLMRTGDVCRGEISVAALAALQDRLLDAVGSLAWQASVLRDLHGRPRVRLALEGTLVLQCQRCLLPMPHDVAHGWQVGVVETEALLPELEEEEEDVDFIVAANPVSVMRLVEEELLLSLPMMPRHETAACHGPEGRADKVVPARASPFAGLDKLRKP